MLTITVDDSAFRATVRRLQDGMSDLTPVIERIGYTRETNIRGRFETRTDPNGQPWKPWAEQMRATYPFPGTVYATGDEGGGTIRWLRPDFQDPARRAARAAEAAAAMASTPPPAPNAPAGAEPPTGMPPISLSQTEQLTTISSWVQADFCLKTPETTPPGVTGADGDAPDAPASAAPSTATALPWPATLPEQVRAVAQRLAASPAPLPLAAIEAAFKGKGPWKKGLPRIQGTLQALGRARREGDGWRG